MAVLYGKITTINDLSHETGSIHLVARDGSSCMQVLDSSSAYMPEGSHVFLRTPRLVEGNGMSVTIEGTAEVSSFAVSHIVAGGDVGIEDCIHIVLVLGFLHHISKFFPVVGVVDVDIWLIFTGGITVDVRVFDILSV